MPEEQTRPLRSWLTGSGAMPWSTEERTFAALLDALTRDRLETEAVERERLATSRRSPLDIQQAQERAEHDELAEARAELHAFRAALTGIRQRGDGAAHGEVPFDSSDREQDGDADVLIQYLVRPGYAEVRTEEPEPAHYVYWILVDWERLQQLANEQGHPLTW